MRTDARAAILKVLQRHAGGEPIQTLGQGRPNWIVGLDRDNVWVETERSRRKATGPQPVPLIWLIDACDVLFAKGLITRQDLTPQSSKRSAFIYSVLSCLPDVDWQDRPIELRVRRNPG